MKYLLQSLVLILLSLTFGTRTFSQDRVVNQGGDQQRSVADASSSMAEPNIPIFNPILKARRAEEESRRLERAKEIRQDNEYTVTGNEKGDFLDNPLMISGTPLDYSDFTLESTGELTVIKKAPVTGKVVEVAFIIYLRRAGIKVSLPLVDGYNSKQMKVNLSEILEHAEAGDDLVIEAVNKEDGAVKRILKLLNSGC